MKAVISLLALIGMTYALPPPLLLQGISSLRGINPSLLQAINQALRIVQARPPVAYILRYDANLGLPTGFSYAVEQSDGFNQAVVGEIEDEGTDEEALAVKGQYSYVGDDGKTYTVQYTADKNGFQPSGEHIPPAAHTSRKLGVQPAALASLAGGGLG